MMAKRMMKSKRRARDLGRRGMSLFLAMVMMISMLQIGVFAAGTGKSSEMQILKSGENDAYYTYNEEQGKLVLNAETPHTEPLVTNRTDAAKSEIKISKTIAGTDTENEFDITLQVETTQNVVKSSEYPDAAVAIVLDVSWSMDYCIECGTANRLAFKNGTYYCDHCHKNVSTRFAANKAAAVEFLRTFAASAAYTDSNGAPQNAKRYVSLTTFAESSTAVPLVGTSAGWIDISDPDNLNAAISKINSLTTAINTNVSAGLATAYNSYLAPQKMPTGSDGKTELTLGDTFVLLLGDGQPQGSYHADAPLGNYAKYSNSTDPEYVNAEKWARKIRTEGARILAAYTGTDPDNDGNSTDPGYEWFKTFSNQYALCSNVNALQQTFQSYINLMRLAANAWEVHDPMGTNYTYVQSNTPAAHITPNSEKTEMTWTLRADTPTVYTSDKDGNKTISYDQYLAKLQAGSEDTFYLVYTASYRIRLDSLGAGATSYAPTNGPTYLTYYLVNEDGKAVNENNEEVYDGDTAAGGKQPMPKLYFNVPAAKALSANLTFTKQATNDQPLTGAVFQMAPSDVTSEYQNTSVATGDNGKVDLTGIPSAHTYTLDETVIPTGHTKAADLPYTVTVAWGEITSVTGTDGSIAFSFRKEETNGTKTYALNNAVKNPFDPAPTNKTVTKVWQAPEGTTLPGSVTVTLTGTNGVKNVYTDTKAITADGNWKVVFEDAPTKDVITGNPITYTVSEDEVSGYTTTYNQSTLTVTNTFNNEYTVSKVWEVLNDNEKTPVKVALLRNGDVIDSLTVTLNNANNWTHTFSGVPFKSPDGTPYTYTVAELSDNGYVANNGTVTLNGKHFDATFNGLTITNRTAQQYITVSGTKTWKGPQDSYTTTVTLQSDEAAAGVFADVADKTAIVTTANPVYTFSNLPKYTSTGAVREIVYRVTDQQEGFSTTGGTQADNYNLVNTIVQVLKDITVTKNWVDDNNADDTRPSTLTLNLMAGGTLYEGKTFDTYSLSADTGYYLYPDTQTIVFEDVPTYNADGKVITYTVAEPNVPNGYTATVEGMTVTNKLNDGTTSRTVQKLWEAPADLIPGSISVSINGGNSVELTANNSWSHTWNDLPVYADGKKITYTITEAVPDNFTLTSKVVDGITYLTNRINDPMNLTVTGTKTWQDNGSVRPSGQITFTLQSDAAKAGVFASVAGKSVTTDIASTESQTYTFEGLPRYAFDEDAGTTSVRYINYRVVDSVSGYDVTPSTVSASAAVENAIIVDLTNTFDQSYTSVSGTKHWVDGNNADGTRPTVITVALLQNDVQIDTLEVTADANGIWQYTFGKDDDGNNTLPVKKNATENYVYTVQELDVPEAYTSSNADASFDITNTRADIDDIRSISVTKYWRGPAADSVTVNLLADGQPTDHTFTLTADNNWTDSVAVPKYNDDGTAIDYTIKESGESEGVVTIGDLSYEVSYDQDLFTLTNTVQQNTTTISGTKTWDLAGSDATLPESLTIALYADGNYTAPVQTQSISADSSWTYTFENLDVYALGDDEDGHEIQYTVYELDPMGNMVTDSAKFRGKQFDVTYDGYNITNTFSPANSDTYRYVAYAHYVTYSYDGVQKGHDTENVIELTTSYDPTSVTVNPDNYAKTSFIYQPGISTLFIGTEQQGAATPLSADATVLFPAGTDTVVTVDVANETYKIDLYYFLTEQAPPPPPPQPPVEDNDTTNYYYRIDYVYTGYDAEGTVIYSDEVTGTVKSKAHDSHSFTADQTKNHDGYSFGLVDDENFSASLKGTSRTDPYVFTVYYEFIELEDSEVPEAPLPLGGSSDEGSEELLEEEIPMAAVPATGDNLMLWVLAAAVSGIGLIWNTISGKKKEEDAI